MAGLSVLVWHAVPAAVVFLMASAGVGTCRGKCGVDGHAFDGLIYLGLLTGIAASAVLALIAATIAIRRWRHRPVLTGTIASIGALVILFDEIRLTLRR